MRRLMIPFVLLTLLALPVMAGAQQNGPLASQNRDDAMRRLEMVRLYKLVELLELSQEESASLFPVLQKYDDQFRAVTVKKGQALREMRREVSQEKPDEAKLRKLVTDILAMEREVMKVRDAQYAELGKVLNAERMAKFMLFERRFNAEMIRMVDDVRGRRHGGSKGGAIRKVKQ